MSASYYNLGDYTRPVTTSSGETQRWFDRGLIWTYGFHHEEAVRCFERAIEHDPDCAMAHWGIANALGANYNKPWEAFDQQELQTSVARAHAALAEATRIAPGASTVEQALIRAAAARYPQAEPAQDCEEWNRRYAEEMRSVRDAFPADLDVAALCAEALMNLTPWALWDLDSSEPAEGAFTEEARSLLEATLETPAGQKHPGLLHFYIHLMEMSPFPEQALKAADSLRGLVPDAGHLEHMPTHIDVLCGHYHSVVTSNQQAVSADRKCLERDGALNFYSLYRAHNLHFVLYGAMFLGQSRTAFDAADELISTLPEELLLQESPPMADWLEGFVPMKLHAMIRFGRWQQTLDLPLPDNRELFCTTTAMTHYAKGVAYAALGEVEESAAQQELFLAAKDRVPSSRYVFNNTCLDILAVAQEMLAGELEYRRGNLDRAFSHLRQSIALDDGLPYDEPWGWMQPTRHAYGALLLEQGEIDQAEAVYRADLGLDGSLARAYQHPDNVWSLHGLHECLKGRGKEREAQIIRQRLDLAVARADVEISSSCFCRRSF